jgi:hypothetical protein
LRKSKQRVRQREIKSAFQRINNPYTRVPSIYLVVRYQSLAKEINTLAPPVLKDTSTGESAGISPLRPERAARSRKPNPVARLGRGTTKNYEENRSDN